MNPFGWWRALGLAGRVTLGVVVAVVLALVLWAVWRVVDAPRRAAEAKIEAKTATAYAAAARAAMDTVAAATARDEQTREKISDALGEIRTLPEDQQYGATIALLCGMREYSGDARCAKLHGAGAEGVGEGRKPR